MIVLKWVFPVSLAVLAIVHLVSCWRGDDDLRKPTKVALMPVVALSYLAFARQPSLWVVAGRSSSVLSSVPSKSQIAALMFMRFIPFRFSRLIVPHAAAFVKSHLPFSRFRCIIGIRKHFSGRFFLCSRI